VTVALPAQPSVAATTTPVDDPLAALGALGEELGLGDMEDDILPAEEAFKVTADADAEQLTLAWNIADGTYLYQDQLKINLLQGDVQLGEYTLPAPDIKKDSIKPDGNFGDVPVYHNQVTLNIPLLRTSNTASEIQVETLYQGCADRGICYPPQKANFTLALPASNNNTSTAKAQTVKTAGQTNNTAPVNEQDALLQDLQSADLMAALLLSLGFGLLVAFTACMYPLIPILTSLIMGQGEKVTVARSFTLSLTYTQSIAITFGILGAVMAFVGQELGIQSSLQTPWVLVPSAILFIALALSMFGFYQIQMPSAIQSRLNNMSNQQKGGNLIGVALMGVLCALIVGPCGGPVLLAVLAFAAQSQDPINGFLYLWVFGTGMGLPLLVMGAGGGALLPKAGSWMDTVKATGGVIMLALALSFLERLSPTYIPTPAIMLGWGLLLIVVAVYMGALRQLPEGGSGWLKLWKGVGLGLLVYGVLFLVGLAAGSKDTMQPLKGASFASHGAASTEHPEFIQVKTVDDLNRELDKAKAAGKPVMLDFYADWCTYCKVMEQEIFPNPKVQAALKGFVTLQANITRQDDADKALAKHLKMPAPPALYFWNSEGALMQQHRFLGNISVEQLVTRAKQVAQ
jgi:thiol:disulfide interchange protein DsbD